MKTFILFWNPAISNWKLDDCRKMIDSEDLFDCAWSVWEHDKVENGKERFFMVRCGEGNTGICQSGYFKSMPYVANDWSGKEREVYYVNLDVDVMIDSEECPVLTTERLQSEFPDFDWTGGHSGRLLPVEYAERLEQIWSKFLEEHETMFYRHAIKRNPFSEDYDEEMDDEEQEVIDSYEDDENEIAAYVGLSKTGEIEVDLRDFRDEFDETIKAWTWKEAKEKMHELLRSQYENYKLEFIEFDELVGSMNVEFEKALDIASWAHRDQKDKAGIPFFGHLARVTLACETDVAKIVALLHDVLEDTDETPESLEEKGVSEFIVKSVVCLTRKPDESYDDFIKRLAPNPIAREVKIADLEDNMDVRRMPELGETDTERLNKYIIAWNYLKHFKAK